MKNINNEIVIIGAGMVGQSIAYQLIERKISNKITIIEKKNAVGLHIWKKQWSFTLPVYIINQVH